MKRRKYTSESANCMAIYIRVSTEKQADFGVSLSDQRSRGISKANELGWSYEIFEDAGLSGKLSVKLS